MFRSSLFNFMLANKGWFWDILDSTMYFYLDKNFKSHLVTPLPYDESLSLIQNVKLNRNTQLNLWTLKTSFMDCGKIIPTTRVGFNDSSRSTRTFSSCCYFSWSYSLEGDGFMSRLDNNSSIILEKWSSLKYSILPFIIGGIHTSQLIMLMVRGNIKGPHFGA